MARFHRVTIIGLGLIGGSLGMAIGTTTADAEIIRMKNGARLECTIVSQDDQEVVVKFQGLERETIKRADIESIETGNTATQVQDGSQPAISSEQTFKRQRPATAPHQRPEPAATTHRLERLEFEMKDGRVITGDVIHGSQADGYLVDVPGRGRIQIHHQDLRAVNVPGAAEERARIRKAHTLLSTEDHQKLQKAREQVEQQQTGWAGVTAWAVSSEGAAATEKLMRAQLSVTEEKYGPNHPEVARELESLAWFLKTQKKDGEAQALLQRAQAIRSKAPSTTR